MTLPPQEPIPNPRIQYTKLFINNEWVDSISGKTFETINPATEKVITKISEADAADVDKAVKCARVAFERGSAWRTLDASARGKLIYQLANLIEENINEIASLESLDQGKPFFHSYLQTSDAIDFLRYYAGSADKIEGNTMPTDGKCYTMTRKEPIGVVGIIISWDFPMIVLGFKMGMALAAGCTTVIKPAKQTPLTALYVANLTKLAGFPPGVVNILPGSGATVGAAIANHMDIEKITFSGTLAVGQKIMEVASKSNLKKITLELGGKAPLVVFDDCILDVTLRHVIDNTYMNAGQTSIVPARLYVQSGIYDEFVKKFIERVLKIKVGGQYDPDTFQGPQIDLKMFNKVLSYISIGKKEGAKCEIGGKRLGTTGYFIEPTVFTNVTEDMTIAKEQILGPVQCILKFDTIEEVINRANNNKFGLAAGVFTESITTAIEFANNIQASVVWINEWARIKPQAPFGGYKMSGMGTELGMESLQEFLNTKTIHIKLSRKP